MSLTKRYHEALLEKIDALETSVNATNRDIDSEFRKVDERMQANASSYRKIQDMNEKYHEQNKKLLLARNELLEISEQLQPSSNLPHPEEL